MIFRYLQKDLISCIQAVQYVNNIGVISFVLCYLIAEIIELNFSDTISTNLSGRLSKILSRKSVFLGTS